MIKRKKINNNKLKLLFSHYFIFNNIKLGYEKNKNKIISSHNQTE